MTVKDLLKKKDLITKEIINIDYHMEFLKCDIKELKEKMPELREKTDEDLAYYIVDMYHKANASSENYDPELDEEMTRIGLKTNDFHDGKKCNKWNTGMFEDDGFGFGNTVTDLYDDYIDAENDRVRKIK